MEIQQLRYFMAVADLGSFSRAASQCGVAQPTLSQQIKRLESTLGQRLFDRLGRTIAITAAGEALLPSARRILAEVNQIEDELNAEPLLTHLRVGAIPTMAPYVLPPAITAFRKRYPDCRLTVREAVTERLLNALVDCEIDLAVMSSPVEHDLIELDIIGQEQLLVATSSRSPIADDPITFAQLRDQPAIVLHEMHCLGRQIDEFCSLRKLNRQIVCRSTQLTTALQLVASGLGISIVPQMCAEAEAKAGCRFLRLARQQPSRPIALAWRSGRSRSPVAKVMASILANLPMMRSPVS